MTRWLLIAAGGALAAAVLGLLVGRARETSRAEELAAALLAASTGSTGGRVDFDALADLPHPVFRYFRHVLTDGQAMIRIAELEQSGILRTRTDIDRWSAFAAHQLIAPPAPGFLWNARVGLPLGAHVRVLDGYVGGVGSGRASLLSAVTVGSSSGAPEMNAGALHRYLAEAVWFPTALLPQSGVTWTPIDGHSARAHLTDHSTTVALDFHFNEAGEAVRIHTERRWGTFEGGYRQVPWEGRFQDYRLEEGMRVPGYGEVGWQVDDRVEWVWKGEVVEARYELGS